MNAFINKVVKWFKKSSFGVVVTTVALIFVVCVGLIINQKESMSVANPSINSEIVTPSVPNEESSEPTPTPLVEKIRMPFTVDAKIARYFFDSSDSIDIKSQALVNYENKFVPSLGIDYTYNNNQFNAVAAFKGVVVEKVNDSLYGLTVVVENEEGLRAHYSGLSEVNVHLKQNVLQGQVIGKTGESVINASLGNHLHFAIEFEDTFLNPLKVYDKTVTEVIK